MLVLLSADKEGHFDEKPLEWRYVIDTHLSVNIKVKKKTGAGSEISKTALCGTENELVGFGRTAQTVCRYGIYIYTVILNEFLLDQCV